MVNHHDAHASLVCPVVVPVQIDNLRSSVSIHPRYLLETVRDWLSLQNILNNAVYSNLSGRVSDLSTAKGILERDVLCCPGL